LAASRDYIVVSLGGPCASDRKGGARWQNRDPRKHVTA
jgi:hypothetical protein